MSHKPLLVVTGVAPFSIGEELVRHILASDPTTHVLGIDIVPNPLIDGIPRYHSIVVNLNPLEHPRGIDLFADDLALSIEEALQAIGSRHIQCLIQSAGVYDAGPFVEHDVTRRKSLLGLNLVGHVEVLHAVMAVNARHGCDNGRYLVHMEIGSFQGLYPRCHRTFYALSKAAHIDLYTALMDGFELHRCFYLAPGLVDTHMLHKNHWVYKAYGSAKFFDDIFIKLPHLYRAIYEDCRFEVFHSVVQSSHESKPHLLSAYDKYVVTRRAAFDAAAGVASREEVAKIATSILRDDRFGSGIYFPRTAKQGALLKYASFKDMVRGDHLMLIGEDMAI